MEDVYRRIKVSEPTITLATVYNIFNFKCADLPTEKFVMENEGFRLENGILRPPMNTPESVSMEKRLELAKACWIWDAEKKGFMRKEAAR